MSVAKMKRDLTPPEAPLPPDFAEAGKQAQGDDITAPRIGELISWSMTIELHATANDPYGRETIEHLREYLRHRGFKMGPARLSIASTKVPRAIASTSTR